MAQANTQQAQAVPDSVAETLEVELTTKRVERLTERIGHERRAQRELSIAEWEALPLVKKLAAPSTSVGSLGSGKAK